MYVNVAERRARLRSELIASRADPLGVEAVKELVIGVHDLDKCPSAVAEAARPHLSIRVERLAEIGKWASNTSRGRGKGIGSGTGHPCRVIAAGKNLSTSEGTSRE